jgi:diguanylate cyclase (GGDEF)-like protein
MASTAFTWERVGPRPDERLLAGKVAGALWISVLPMTLASLPLPGGVSQDLWPVLLALTAPALVWGLLCAFVIPWERVPTPLVYHVPAVLALPYIAVLVAITGVERSPFVLTLLMLIAFATYFFPPRAAVPYVVSSLVVQGFPLIYDAGTRQSELPNELWVSMFVYAAVGGVIMVGKGQLLALREAAQELSRRDSLTGLENRRALTELLDRRASGSGGARDRHGDSLGLLLIDLDDFKEANTLHGLPGGDRVLCATADALRALSRDEDMVVRLGGDEFAIVGHGFSPGSMERLAGRVLESVQEASAALDLPQLRITASAGWAVYPDNAESIHQLVTVADLSLRAAKAQGKNRWQSPLAEIEQLVS